MKIGIIGSGGTGMCAAWLLDKDHDIILFEKNNYLGGHTHSVKVELNGKSQMIDDGVAWFSPKIYPYFNTYLDMVHVEYDWLPLSLTYYNKPNNHINCIPPITGRNIFRMFTKKNILSELLALNKAANAASKLVKQHKTNEDFKSFIERLPVSEKVKTDFLRPLLTGLWGAPFDQTNGFSIYPLMKYIVYHKPSGLKYYKWKIMKGGTKQYIETVHKSLNRTTTILNTEVIKIETDEVKNKVKVFTSTGTYFFDKLIITGGARDTSLILQHSPDFKKAHDILKQFKYYQATLATHSDISFMPPDKKDWAIVNVTFNGENSFSTIWHGSKTGEDIFCSYVNPTEKMPEKLHHVSQWWLPCEPPHFFELQTELAAVQGMSNVFFGGDYTHDIGSHEDAITSAIKAVEKIDPSSTRLIQLKNDSQV